MPKATDRATAGNGVQMEGNVHTSALKSLRGSAKNPAASHAESRQGVKGKAVRKAEARLPGSQSLQPADSDHPDDRGLSRDSFAV